jgi:hypothetical protein
MAIMKRYNNDQKSKLKQLNRELESSKREYNTNIENLKNLFEQELTYEDRLNNMLSKKLSK